MEWYEYYGYATKEEYAAALLKHMKEVSFIIANVIPKTFNIVPVGFYPNTKCYTVFNHLNLI
jgi:hypothetical protein